MKALSILFGITLLAGCAGSGLNSSGGGSSTAENNNFYQHWVHAYEEQGGQKSPNIFRPKGSQNFPPSRFRMEFAFNPNGECSYMHLGANDAHQLRSCVYTKIGNTVYLYDNAGGSLSHLAFTIQSLSPQQLRLAYGVSKAK